MGKLKEAGHITKSPFDDKIEWTWWEIWHHEGRRARNWLLAGILLGAALTGNILWELVNPVTMVFRGLVFGMGLAWGMVAAIFLFDLLVSRRGWCGHLCPVGAFYGLVGHFSPLRVKAARREQCDDCRDCFSVCPEHQVIWPALKGADKAAGAVIDNGHCTNCGRCIDVCPQQVFEFTTRFPANRWGTRTSQNREVLS